MVTPDQKIKVHVFPANNGDSILLELPEITILIDGGYVNTFTKFLKPELQSLAQKGKRLTHVIVTHIDGDHISGVNRFLQDNNLSRIIEIDHVWHNAFRHLQDTQPGKAVYDKLPGKPLDTLPPIPYIKENKDGDRPISAEQGSTLATLIAQGKYLWNQFYDGKAISVSHKIETELAPGVKMILLSPDNTKLNALYHHWRKELYKLGYTTTGSKEGFFDDAFEFITALERPAKILVDKTVSTGDIDLAKLAEADFTEDTATANGSSIAFVLEVGTKKLIFLADAHPSLIVQSLKTHYGESAFPMKFDLIKLSHHGSALNTSKELLALVDSENYIISTNGNTFNHPDIETIARIVTRKSEFGRSLYFNYPNPIIDLIKGSDNFARYKFETVSGDGNHDLFLEI